MLIIYQSFDIYKKFIYKININLNATRINYILYANNKDMSLGLSELNKTDRLRISSLNPTNTVQQLIERQSLPGLIGCLSSVNGARPLANLRISLSNFRRFLFLLFTVRRVATNKIMPNSKRSNNVLFLNCIYKLKLIINLNSQYLGL